MLLNYRQYSNQGPALVILHGLFGNLGNWGWHSKQLAEDFSVYGVDLRNHGDSFHDDELNYQVMAEDLKELLAYLQLGQCFLIGHSMGGKVAMQLVQSSPQLVSKLVVVDIAPVAYPSSADGHLDVMDGMEAMDFSKLTTRKDVNEQLRGYIPDEATRSFVLTNLIREGEGYSWRINLSSIRKNYDRLREKPKGEQVFEKPVLFIKGDKSNYISLQHQEEILRLFPQASVKIVMEAGHWVHAEKPQLVQKLIKNFLLEEEK